MTSLRCADDCGKHLRFGEACASQARFHQMCNSTETPIEKSQVGISKVTRIQQTSRPDSTRPWWTKPCLRTQKKAAIPTWEEEEPQGNAARELTDISDVPLEDEDSHIVWRHFSKLPKETGNTSISSNAMYYITASHTVHRMWEKTSSPRRKREETLRV